MKKDKTGLTKLGALMNLQDTKLGLALDTIQAIAELAADRSMFDKDSILIKDLVPILNEFIERMEELCSEPAL